MSSLFRVISGSQENNIYSRGQSLTSIVWWIPGGESHKKMTGMLVASRFGVEIAFFRLT